MDDPCSNPARRRPARRRIRLFGAACIALLALPSEPGEAAERSERLRGMQAEISRLEGELHQLQRRESGLLGELERLGGELRLRQAELEEVTLRREQVGLAVAERSRRLRRVERAQDERKEYLAFRLREVYKSGPEQTLRRFVGEAGIDRYWEGVRYAAYLSERDARVLRAYRLDLRRLSQEHAALERELGELERTGAQLVEARQRLEGSRRSRSRRIEEIRDDQSKRRVALDELESATQQLGRLIDTLDPVGPGPTLDMRKFRGLLDWPAEGTVAAGFGSVVHPRFKTRVPHPGLDIDGELGSSIRSVFDGQVVFAAWMRGYGLTAIVDHGGGVLSVYAHASVLMVEPGDSLRRGQRIGAIGDTGSLRGPYLYFELREDGAPVDPRLWLRPR